MSDRDPKLTCNHSFSEEKLEDVGECLISAHKWRNLFSNFYRLKINFGIPYSEANQLWQFL